MGIDPDRFEAYLRDEAGIAEAWRLAGDSDFEVRLSCRSLTSPSADPGGRAGAYVACAPAEVASAQAGAGSQPMAWSGWQQSGVLASRLGSCNADST